MEYSVMDRHETRTQETVQQPPASPTRGLLSDTIAGLEAFFPHRQESSAPTARMEQRDMATAVEDDSSYLQGDDFGDQPQAQQLQQCQPGAAAQPGQHQHAAPGRRPLFRS